MIYSDTLKFILLQHWIPITDYEQLRTVLRKAFWTIGQLLWYFAYLLCSVGARLQHVLRVVPLGDARCDRGPSGCCARSRRQPACAAEARAARRWRRGGRRWRAAAGGGYAVGRTAGPAAAFVRRARRALARWSPLYQSRLARPTLARRWPLRRTKCENSLRPVPEASINTSVLFLCS